MTKKHYPLIRTIYLYLFALTGLTLIVIGSVRFVDMGLKMFVFTRAEEETDYYGRQLVMPSSIERLEKVQSGELSGEDFTEEEKMMIKSWLEEYKIWKEKYEIIDPVKSKRHRDASVNLAMILVGLPLYLFHWSIIRKETKNKTA